MVALLSGVSWLDLVNSETGYETLWPIRRDKRKMEKSLLILARLATAGFRTPPTICGLLVEGTNTNIV